MTDPVRVPPLTSPFLYPMGKHAEKRRYAEECFQTHPTVDVLIFEAVFPNSTESVTVSREEILMPLPRDFEAWKMEVESR